MSDTLPAQNEQLVGHPRSSLPRCRHSGRPMSHVIYAFADVTAAGDGVSANLAPLKQQDPSMT